MIVGVPRELKEAEQRIALTPAAVARLVGEGNEVRVEAAAGIGSGFDDSEFERAGARVAGASDVWGADLVVKVKEPMPSEFARLREGQVLFSFLHLAADAPLTEALIAAGTTAIAFETVVDDKGRLPILAPMSEIAGRLAAQAVAHHSTAPVGGTGTLLGGIPGVAPAHVVIVGGGIVGASAARIALGLGASVTLFDTSLERLRELEVAFDGRIELVAADASELQKALPRTDALIGAVLIPGALAPRLADRTMIGTMASRSIVCDVSIDQGGCFETSRPTSHLNPTYEVDGVIHYCVSNIPGAVPRTSTKGLSNAAIPFVSRLAGGGVPESARVGSPLHGGFNVLSGHVTHEGVARAHGYDAVPVERVV